MIKNYNLEMVIGCVDKQESNIKETVPSLMPALLFADKVTIIADEADTIIELRDYHDIKQIFQDSVDLVSFDECSYEDAEIESVLSEKYYTRLETLEKYGLSDTAIHNDCELRNLSQKRNEQLQKERLKILQSVEGMINRPEVMPLIDDPNGLLSSNIQHLGSIALGTRSRRQMSAKLGTEIITKIPSFQDLNHLEIFELRKRLSDSLIPFRSSVVEMSSSLALADGDKDAIADIIHEIYLVKVIPAVDELARQTSENTFLRRLLNDFGRDPSTFIQSFVTFGIGELADLPQYLSISAAIASQIISVASKKIETGKKISSNNLFFVHELDRLTKRMKR